MSASMREPNSAAVTGQHPCPHVSTDAIAASNSLSIWVIRPVRSVLIWAISVRDSELGD